MAILITGSAGHLGEALIYHEDVFPDGPYPVEETNRPQGIR